MPTEIYDLLPEDVKKAWDEEDYKIFSPEKLSDKPVVTVILINQNETEIVVELPVVTPQA
jgi:hypothetical protein